jgi:hypothetical protein
MGVKYCQGRKDGRNSPEKCVFYFYCAFGDNYYQNEPNPFENAGEDGSAKNEEKPTGVPDTSSNTSVASDRGATETKKE